MTPEKLIFIGGILHFGILLASFAVPFVLDWKGSLKKLDPLFAQVVWTHGVFIVMVIIAFGFLSVLYPEELSAGSPLAKAVCVFISFFWGSRLVVQFFIFDAKPHLKIPILKLGYHGLTLVFLFHTVVYSYVAFR
jgi:hypothetical protein